MREQREYGLSLVTPPVLEPITLAEAKLYARVDGTADDAAILDMIVAVRQAAEAFLRRSLITQSWKLTYEDAAPSCVSLYRTPVQSVTRVTLVAKDGTQLDLDDAVYHLNPGKTRLHFDATPQAYHVEILYVAGYGGANEIPAAIRQGMLTHLAAIYDNRVLGADLPDGTAALYQPYREVRLV